MKSIFSVSLSLPFSHICQTSGNYNTYFLQAKFVYHMPLNLTLLFCTNNSESV